MTIDSSKSFATEENLIKALRKIGVEPGDGNIVVRNREGRWTAVFSFAVYGARPAHLGYMTFA